MRYALNEKGETTYITIEDATSSREWLMVAMRHIVASQDLATAANAGAVLELLT